MKLKGVLGRKYISNEVRGNSRKRLENSLKEIETELERD
jgi:hypothetical protein